MHTSTNLNLVKPNLFIIMLTEKVLILENDSWSKYNKQTHLNEVLSNKNSNKYHFRHCIKFDLTISVLR